MIFLGGGRHGTMFMGCKRKLGKKNAKVNFVKFMTNTKMSKQSRKTYLACTISILLTVSSIHHISGLHMLWMAFYQSAWLTAVHRPPVRPKSAKAGVKSGPLEITLESTIRDGNLFWFICATHAQKKTHHHSDQSEQQGEQWSSYNKAKQSQHEEWEDVCEFQTQWCSKGDLLEMTATLHYHPLVYEGSLNWC